MQLEFVALVILTTASCAPSPAASAVVAAQRESHDAAVGMEASAAPATAVDAAMPAPDAGATASPSMDGGAAALPWPDAEACSFPAVSPAEGTTAKQCCHPSPEVTLCLETVSLIHHHEVGPYTARVLKVTRAANAQDSSSFPLDRQSHGSMARPDVVSALLSFRVQQTGLELRVRAGCQGLCTPGRCSKEDALRAGICASAGQYAWDGERLVRR